MITTLEEYQIREAQLRAQVFQADFDELKNRDIQGYIMTSANRDYLLGKKSTLDLQTFYREFIFQSKWHEIECRETDLGMISDWVKVKGDTRFIEDKNSGPYTFAGFHFGPYFMESLTLSKRDVECVILAQNRAFNDVMRNYYIKNLSSNPNSTMILDDEVIQPSSMQSLLNIVKKVRSGKNLMGYLDGFEAMGRSEDKSRMAKVKFCGRTLSVRKGIPKMAYKLKTPIITMVSHREKNGDLTTTYMSPIDPKAFSTEQEFIQTYLQSAFSSLESFFRQSPEQFILLNLLHRSWEAEAEPVADPVKTDFDYDDSMCFNDARFGIFPKKDKQLLFDKQTYLYFNISEGLADFLNNLEPRPFGELNQIINQTLLSDLLKKQVIINL